MGGENFEWRGGVEGGAGAAAGGGGKHGFGPFGLSGGRLIPAWAGKTRGATSNSRGRWAHPRVGGENLGRRCTCHAPRGSSPRGRGKRRVCAPGTGFPGLIPAWAGKTPRPARDQEKVRAHPRVGGENAERVGQWPLQGGSSPRGRGKRNPDRASPAARRLIPGWAGKTSRTMAASAASRAHPRVGGENGSGAVLLLDQSGSSPRGRGKP